MIYINLFIMLTSFEYLVFTLFNLISITPGVVYNICTSWIDVHVFVMKADTPAKVLIFVQVVKDHISVFLATMYSLCI